MNRRIIKLLSFCLLCMICFASCERYPVRTLLGLPKPIDSWPDPWYIYDDEINTKGSLEPKRWEDDPSCADWNKVKLDFDCLSNPKNGRKCMQLTWVGNVNDPNSGFFGFGLMAREEGQAYKYIDLSTSEYTSLKFWIRGTLYNNCSFKIEIPKSGGGSWAYKTLSATEVTPYWTEYTIQLPNIDDMTDIEYDISISLIADGTTNGGSVYLDDIRFTRD